jgi:hypothetical protein
VTSRLHHGRLKTTISALLDAGLDLLPHYELAMIPVLDAAERPAEWPEIRRRLKAEGVRAKTHRGVFLLTPGDLDVIASVGVFRGIDELFLCSEWNEELEQEPFPGRISSDQHDFNESTPLGLEEWMIDAGCLLALGDGDGLNFATLDPALAERLRKQFQVVKV